MRKLPAAVLASLLLSVPVLAFAQDPGAQPAEPAPGAGVNEPATAPKEEAPPPAPATTPATETAAAAAGAVPGEEISAGTEGGGDKLEWKFNGRIQTDLRFRVNEKSMGSWYNVQTLPVGVERNQNLLQAKLQASYGKYAGVADCDFVWLGYVSDISRISQLSAASEVDPYYLKLHSLYVEASDFLVEGLDLRVGQQLVLWGKADQFNPTNNLNANDLEDILLFGEQLGNLMVKADYNFVSDWGVSGVLVPIFKPALLPRSAPLGLAALDRLPFIDTNLRYRVRTEQGYAASQGYPTEVSEVHPVLPDRSLGNMQFAFRIAGSVLEQDLAFSFYQGFTDIPVAMKNMTHQLEQLQANPASTNGCGGAQPDYPNDCIKGKLETDTYVAYPAMRVAGFNMAGEVNALGWISSAIKPIGYRLELAVVFPEKQDIALIQDNINIGGFQEPAGEYDYCSGPDPTQTCARPLVVNDTPFLKWTLGLDYTFNRYFYMNVMWVHGLADEFGAGDFINQGYVVRQGKMKDGYQQDYMTCAATAFINGQSVGPCGEKIGKQYAVEIIRPRIGDYVVIGLDFKFADDKGLLRLFAMWDISGYYQESWDDTAKMRVRKYLSLFGDGFSGILYPEFNYNFSSGFELGLGALLQFGKDFTKFGDPAAGGSLVWARARFRY